MYFWAARFKFKIAPVLKCIQEGSNGVAEAKGGSQLNNPSVFLSSIQILVASSVSL